MFKSDTQLVYITSEKGAVSLEVRGEVEIENRMKETKYIGDERFEDEKLIKLIRSGEVYKSTEYFVDLNNWFAIIFLDKEGNSIDDCVFEEEPKSFSELIVAMEKYYNYYVENYVEDKKASINTVGDMKKLLEPYYDAARISFSVNRLSFGIDSYYEDGVGVCLTSSYLDKYLENKLNMQQ